LLVNWNKLAKAIRASQHVWAVEYLAQTLRLSEAGSIQSYSPAQVTYGDRIGLSVTNASITPDELRVELAWTNVVTVDRQLTAFVHVYDAQGQLVAQQDGYPLLGLYPPWLAPQGETVRDLRRISLRRIPLPASQVTGHLKVGVGVYDAETGERLAALLPGGERLENDVYLFYEFDIKNK
jgi:hypothetical protein